MADLAVKIAATPPENLGLVRAGGLLLFGVFALKAALIPLHLWLPAAYSATSAPVAALFAIMTKVGAYCLLRVGTLMFGEDAGPMANLYAHWLLPLALMTLIIGALGCAVGQGTAPAGGLSGRGLGGSAAHCLRAWHSSRHRRRTLLPRPHHFCRRGLFSVGRHHCQWPGSSAGSTGPGPAIPRAGLIGGLFFMAAVLIVGLPPLSGFLGKFLVLRAGLADPAWPWVMGVVLTSGLLGLIALTRSGSLLFLRAEGMAEAAPTRIGALVPVVGLLALGLAMTIWASPIVGFTNAAAHQLMRPQGYIQAVLGVSAQAEHR